MGEGTRGDCRQEKRRERGSDQEDPVRSLPNVQRFVHMKTIAFIGNPVTDDSVPLPYTDESTAARLTAS